VFITSRIYGGYANGQTYPENEKIGQNCLNPEPYAYEGGFAVQRTVVSQINQAYGQNPPDSYTGSLNYNVAPWVDWAPYLWASGATQRSEKLAWCNGQTTNPCDGEYDFRYGDLNRNFPLTYWGDFTHPTASATSKVATLLVNFMVGSAASPWVSPWIGQ